MTRGARIGVGLVIGFVVTWIVRLLSGEVLTTSGPKILLFFVIWGAVAWAFFAATAPRTTS